MSGCAPEGPQPARFLSAFTIETALPDFGGLSGIELSADGRDMVAVTDRGRLVRGRILRRDGRITGVEIAAFGPMTLDMPTPEPILRDSEGLAIAPDGRIFVSLEGRARVVELAAQGRARRLPGLPAFAALPINAALEALAIDPQGRLVTIPEKSSEWDAPFPVWRLEDGAWRQVFSITRDPGFLPVGADYGPDGALYVLERGFNGLGFRSRVRRFDLLGTAPQRGRVMFTAPALRHDNLEGLAVWRDAQGRVRLTLVSDDNHRALQRTEIVDYVIENPLQ